ncbi:unnamed protein product [Spirodela intermedia]|uniref:CRM-domain containing factor CFM3, chloroplastic/mitochondrial n=1 Tax=Spirodela intermedia TaxID=51605 RepID=A0A7I8L024_SPIIN|nr:unnamed protein product [Spirodela intermedia]
MAAAGSSPFSLGLSPTLSSPPAAAPSSSIPFSVFRFGRCTRGAAVNSRRLHLRRSFRARLLPCEEGTEEEPSSRGTTITPKKTQKPRSDFYEQTGRWSVKVPSQRTRFPWQEKVAEVVEEKNQEPFVPARSPRKPLVAENGSSPMARPVRNHQMGRVVSTTSPQGSKSRGALSSSTRTVFKQDSKGSKTGSAAPEVSIRHSEDSNEGQRSADSDSGKRTTPNDYPDFLSLLMDEIDVGGEPPASVPVAHGVRGGGTSLNGDDGRQIPCENLEANKEAEKSMISSILETLKTSRNKDDSDLNPDMEDEDESVSVVPTRDTISFPWAKDGVNSDGQKSRWKSNTLLAEKTIPEPELRRLRNVALRMKERTKVGASGVNEALVERIRRKWKEVEVVKLKFEGPPALHMKSTHDILEKRTGGIVIWRSGSSLVLYRGMTYGLPGMQTYPKHDDSVDISSPSPGDLTGIAVEENKDDGSIPLSNSSDVISVTSDDPSLGSNDKFDIDSLLDELGPRFRDWSGRNPLPVDADLLPAVVPGYKPPFRLLPYKTKLVLRNGEMTYLRRLARSMPPHFALGRSRMLQGLAQAIVKLWEKSIIAKIAIKRGVPNTCNERMAEEIKKLTGGVLLSRNKEFVVFYRGNDFLVPTITEVLSERQNLANVRQDEEEQARLRASAFMASSTRASTVPLVAGTLAETLEAKTRWDSQPDDEEREKMARELTLERHASDIRFLEKKLNIAREKVNRAEKALMKVQAFLSPAELPTDLETVTDEERSLYRKMGLKMKAFLSLGRREVFDGTVENMHLNWKHRELVKIIVRGKSFPQVKHIAISLEAESGGVLISVDKTTKGYAIIVYRGKNYRRPQVLRPKNLLTRRQALARSIELQRREALNFHISTLRDRIEMLKSDLERMKVNGAGHQDARSLLDRLYLSDDDVEDEGEEAYLGTYDSDDDDVDE